MFVYVLYMKYECSKSNIQLEVNLDGVIHFSSEMYVQSIITRHNNSYSSIYV